MRLVLWLCGLRRATIVNNHKIPRIYLRYRKTISVCASHKKSSESEIRSQKLLNRCVLFGGLTNWQTNLWVPVRRPHSCSICLIKTCVCLMVSIGQKESTAAKCRCAQPLRLSSNSLILGWATCYLVIFVRGTKFQTVHGFPLVSIVGKCSYWKFLFIYEKTRFFVVFFIVALSR